MKHLHLPKHNVLLYQRLLSKLAMGLLMIIGLLTVAAIMACSSIGI